MSNNNSTKSTTSSDSSAGSPSDALIRLSAPDGYYDYLGISKPKENSEIDVELIKKNYRKLSLKHHPDRPKGDTDTFRLLNRAQQVLLHSRLRQEYDLLGLDLDDDTEEMNEESAATGDADSKEKSSQSQQDSDGKEKTDSSSSSSSSSVGGGVLHEMASQALTTIMQLAIRTLMMATVSILLVRYQITVCPVLAFLAFVAYRIHRVSRATGGNVKELLPPFLIAMGLIAMHRARRFEFQQQAQRQLLQATLTSTAATAMTKAPKAFWSFWFGESLVITIFTLNSMTTFEHFHKSFMLLALSVGGASIVLALWLRGNIWSYATLLGLEVIVGVLVAMAFPIMEILLENIINDKLKKVGEKVRAHHQQLEAYYQSKMKR